MPVEPDIDQNDGGEREGDHADCRKDVSKMAPVGRHQIEHTAGHEGKRHSVRTGHPLAMNGDLPVPRRDHSSGRADNQCRALHGSSRQARSAPCQGDSSEGADDDRSEVDTAQNAMELQVALPETGRELERARQQREGSAERVRDEKSAVGDDL